MATFEEAREIQRRCGEHVAEIYQNAQAPASWWSVRFWADRRLLVGGAILGAKDWEHLRRDLGVERIIEVSTETRDIDFVPEDRLLHLPTPDGQFTPPELFIAAVDYAISRWSERIYVHCFMGESRSPSFAYAILRWRGLKPHEALDRIERIRPGWGAHPLTALRLETIERAYRQEAE